MHKRTIVSVGCVLRGEPEDENCLKMSSVNGCNRTGAEGYYCGQSAKCSALCHCYELYKSNNQ